MRKIVIMYYSTNHENPTKAQRHKAELTIPDNFGKIDSIEIVEMSNTEKLLEKIL